MILAPMRLKHSTVVSISRLVAGHTIEVGASAKAAQIKYRWAMDFEGIAEISPFSLFGYIISSI